MDVEFASPPSTKRRKLQFTRVDRPVVGLPSWAGEYPSVFIWIAISVVFVILGVDCLDLGSVESRLGLAAGEQLAPMGQIYGYWTPDVWPAQLAPSVLLARWHVSGRPSTADIRWPSAVAAILIGWLLTRTMQNKAGTVPSVLLAVTWFGSIGLMDRSAEAGMNMILGLGTIATINRLLTRGSDWTAGAWASLAFLAGGWPPLVVIGLAVIVIGQNHAGFSMRLLLPPFLTATVWSAIVLTSASAEIWASALMLPLVQRFDWKVAINVFLLGLPWSPALVVAAMPSVRKAWNDETRSWLTGWIQVSIAALIGGTIVPGLREPAQMLALAGVAVISAAVLQVAWSRAMSGFPHRTFQTLMAATLFSWLTVMLYGMYVWNMAMPYYRFLGVTIGIIAFGVTFLGISALATGNSRRSVVTLMVLAVGLKIAHSAYYAPEWNYRLGQGSWGRAIGQWVPRKWPLYTFHHWPTELAFAVERPVRQLMDPSFLDIQAGPQSKYVLLTRPEYESWPAHAKPITVVNIFKDWSGEEQSERILARTAGTLPAPGQKVPSRD